MEFIGAKSLDELPASDVLSSRQIDDWLKTSANPHRPNDTDVGLADEQLPLEGAAVAAPVAEAEAPVETPSAETSPVETPPAEPPAQN